MTKWIASLGLGIALVLGAGCGQGSGQAEESGPPVVLATTTHLADIARRVGGEDVEVVALMGPGVDPHLYKASAGDLDRLNRADLVIYHGLNLEGRMADALSTPSRPDQKIVSVERILEGENLIMSAERVPDPHVWNDPELWAKVVRGVGSAIEEAAPEASEAITKRTEEMAAEVEALADELRTGLSALPEDRRLLVTAHDAFAYLGRATGLEVRGLQGISTSTEAGVGSIRELADEITRRNVRAIFAETSVNPAGINALMEALKARGADVILGANLYSDALGEPDSPAGTYLGMMRTNLETIRAGLSR